MKYDEILNVEKRTEDNLYRINLMVGGNSNFERSYETSAYLLAKYLDLCTDNDPLSRVKVKYKKKEEGLIFIGFPSYSRDKFIEGLYEHSIECDEENTEYISFDASFLKEKGVEITVDNYETILSEWKSEVEYSKSNPPKKNKKSNLTEKDMIEIAKETENEKYKDDKEEHFYSPHVNSEICINYNDTVKVPEGLFTLSLYIMRYDLENATSRGNYEFIASLKNSLIKLLWR